MTKEAKLFTIEVDNRNVVWSVRRKCEVDVGGAAKLFFMEDMKIWNPDPHKVEGMAHNQNCRARGAMKEVVDDASSPNNHKDKCVGNWNCPVTETSEPRVRKQWGGNKYDPPLPAEGTYGHNKFVDSVHERVMAARQGCKPWW